MGTFTLGSWSLGSSWSGPGQVTVPGRMVWIMSLMTRRRRHACAAFVQICFSKHIVQLKAALKRIQALAGQSGSSYWLSLFGGVWGPGEKSEQKADLSPFKSLFFPQRSSFLWNPLPPPMLWRRTCSPSYEKTGQRSHRRCCWIRGSNLLITELKRE